MLPLKQGKAVSRGRAELTQPWADTSESWGSAPSRSLRGCGGDNLGSTPRSVAAEGGSLPQLPAQPRGTLPALTAPKGARRKL